MADVFEDRDELEPHRRRLWALIEETPNLDWLLLTKRPHMIARTASWGNDWPSNIWIGTTVELQARADELPPHLAENPAAVRFISAEPLLGPLDLRPWLGSVLNWVITGGESGPHARPASPSWFRDLHLQCMRASIPFHFKQWGDWASGDGGNPLEAAKVRQAADGTTMLRLGKKKAGRALDGAVHDQIPNARVKS